MESNSKMASLFVLTAKDWKIENSQLPLLLVSVILASITSMIRMMTFREFGKGPEYAYLPSNIEIFGDSISIIIFHIILFLILQLAYPENGKYQAQQLVAYAAQLLIIVDLLSILYAYISLIAVTSYSNWQIREMYGLIWMLSTVIAVFYLAIPIIERLKESFEDRSKIIIAALILSAIIYWVSFGLGLLIKELLLLPFGGF